MTDPSSQESLALKSRAQALIEELVAACEPSPAMRRMLGAGWEGFHEIDGAAVRFYASPGRKPHATLRVVEPDDAAGRWVDYDLQHSADAAFLTYLVCAPCRVADQMRSIEATLSSATVLERHECRILIAGDTSLATIPLLHWAGAFVCFSWLDPYTQFAAARVERAARQFLADIADTP
ncbi:MAG: hypothetical protein OXS47_04115 [Chloroflexota bacterium]|nr:hypothetical protein [Chloroflexota bacterium]